MSLNDYAQLATILVVLINTLAFIGLAFQIYYSRKQVEVTNIQIQADHERSRREFAVQLLVEWSKNLKKEGSLARKIIDNLNEEQCKCIFNQQAVKIESKHENLVEQFFHGCSHEQDENSNFCISSAQSSELRWHAITYLNSLEFTLVAWQHAVADRSILETQYRYLFDPESGISVLNTFRKVAGGSKSYPAIEAYYQHLCSISTINLQTRSIVA